MVLEEGDIVLCTVDRIVGTIVFVKIEGEKKEGSLTLSEIAPGRIRNLRDYVVPKKKIVCKVLRTGGETTNLSLRRVTQKEQKEIMSQYKQERSYESLMKSILGEKAKEIIEKIREEQRLYDFIEEAKENTKELEKIVGKDNSSKLMEIIGSQKKKNATIRKEISLITTESEGINLIKKILGEIKEAEITYISAGKYSVKTEAEDMKKADVKIREILGEIEKLAKENKIEFSFKEK